MIYNILRFSLAISILMGGGFFLHEFLLDEQQLLEIHTVLLKSYVYNGLLSLLIFLGLLWFIKQKTPYAAWLFMLGSLLKLVFYFVYFFPQFMQDNTVSKVEFLSFFIPYAIALLAETIGLVRTLQAKSDN